MENDKRNSKEGIEDAVPVENHGDHLSQNELGNQHTAGQEIEDGKLLEDGDALAVKFISTDSQNGDAKIDIENVKVAFAGMGKDELMKFANDPFWIRMRWFLFILFWLLWVAMLAGAIVIIVMAPKCAAPPPRDWWQKSPMYSVVVPSFEDGDFQDGVGDLKGLESKVDYLADLKVSGVAISSVLKSSDRDSETIEDFKALDPVFGTIEDFKSLLEKLKKKGLELVMSFVLNHSSDKHPWFLKSIKKEGPYTNYYVWASAAGTDYDDRPLPPNNWISVYNDSAWEWNEERGQFYLHQFARNQPDLNFWNENLVEEVKDILRFWLDLGVSGFQFDKVEYLFENQDLTDEPGLGRGGSVHTDYSFHNHIHTKNLPQVFDFLVELKEVVKNYTEPSRILSTTGGVRVEDIESYNGNSTNMIVDLPQNLKLASSLRPHFTAQDLYNEIEKQNSSLQQKIWGNWQVGNQDISRVATRLSPDVVDGLNMVIMLLPGTPITYYGEEIGMKDSVLTTGQSSQPLKLPYRNPMQWDNSSNAGFSNQTEPWIPVNRDYQTLNVAEQNTAEESHLKVYQALAKERTSPAILYGTTEMKVVNGTVFSYTRLKRGNPGYLVAFNTANEPVTVSFKDFAGMPDDISVLIRSTNMGDQDIKVKSKVLSDAVSLPAKAAAVFSFVPKSE